MSAARPDILPRVLKVSEAWYYGGFRSATDFYAYVRSGLEPRFPQPLPPRQIPAKAGDTEPRYAGTEYDRTDIDAWIELRKEPLKKADASAAALLERVRAKRVQIGQAARARRGARRGSDGSSGPSSSTSSAS